MSALDDAVIGWDVGGAHLKACLLRHGTVHDVAQWVCPLWQGPDALRQALARAAARWPGLAAARHAVTMTGEMVDRFNDREDGVRQIAALLTQALAPRPAGGSGAASLWFFAGDAGWCSAEALGRHWRAVASANWLATAGHAASCFDAGVLLDIGSTTTDIVAFGGGRVQSRSRSDFDRLASGELSYHGVVRTPLCAVAPRIGWRGATLNVMNEWFATSADVYRLTGELDPAHDLQPSADAAPKDLPATRQRLARMVGLDRRDATDAEWLELAFAWRALQVAELGAQLQRVLAGSGRLQEAGGGVVVGAGCGAFLVADVMRQALGATGMRLAAYGRDVARAAPDAAISAKALAAWAQVAAPSVAVAVLFERDRR